ncbi:MAG TPA: hypothetical protein VFW09_06095 [Solirubrobacteraceae bacterium]|nr:hypothetical protein [Solirubrobacteraceae bacterium]
MPLTRGPLRHIAVAAACAAALLIAAPGVALASHRSSHGPFRFFGSSSVWNRRVPAHAPLDHNSRAVVGNLLAQEASEPVGISSYAVPIYWVGASAPTVSVTLNASSRQSTLSQAFKAVPLPGDAVPAKVSDGTLAVYQPSTDTMWEFWRLSKGPGGWQAAFGGRMVHVSTDPGYYRNVFSPGGSVLERSWWGAPASSLALVGGVMTIAQLESGQINHALCLAVGNTRAGAWSWPAQRSDGTLNSPNAVPEGAHFRLDPNLNLKSLHLPHFVYMMAVAAQKYGIIINNRSGGVSFRAEDPTQFEAAHGYNPYFGPHNRPGSRGALFDQWPSQMMRLFPWRHLQLLKMQLHSHPATNRVVESPPS